MERGTLPYLVETSRDRTRATDKKTKQFIGWADSEALLPTFVSAYIWLESFSASAV